MLRGMQQPEAVTFSVRAPKVLHQKVLLLARRERRSLSAQVVKVLEEWLASNGPERALAGEETR